MNQKILFFLFVLISANAFSQSQESLIWSKDGQFFYSIQNGDIVMQNPGNANAKKWVDGKLLIPKGAKSPIEIQKFSLSVNQELVLIQTHSKKVWRYETMGDFYLFNTKTNQLQQIGKEMPAAKAKFILVVQLQIPK
jgi:dipeptidyl-peptidase-4